jgi:monoamine oxidase
VKRRLFLEMVGRSGGALAALRAMEAIGLAEAPASDDRFALSGRARGQHVVIVGGGVAGLTTAFELAKAGYDCTVLEARRRAGGRVFTVRRGTVETDVDGHRQEAAFDDGLYLNAGAMRIPQHHTITLDYCRELGVPVEPFLNCNEGGWLYHTQGGALAGQRVRMRAARADLQGYIAELLEKALDAGALDQDLDQADRERLLEFLERDGSLRADGKYVGSSRRGFAVPPGAGEQAGRVDGPMALRDLLAANFGRQFGQDSPLPQQMFQVVGGTDRLTDALASRVGARLRLGTTVTAVRQVGGRDGGVRVEYIDAGGVPQVVEGDFGVLAVPLSVLRSMPVDLSPSMRQAVAAIPYSAAGKIGLQFSRRFWEEDDGIFGGISRTDQEITQIVYPSTGFLSRKGLLIGYYHNGETARRMAERPPAERQRVALEQGGRIHPQYADTFETAYSVAWHKTPHSLGGWAQYSPDLRRQHYARLNEPDGALYLAGEHLSYITGWIAGALGSARLVATRIHERASREASAVETAKA